jgi:hypothetical protein
MKRQSFLVGYAAGLITAVLLSWVMPAHAGQIPVTLTFDGVWDLKGFTLVNDCHDGDGVAPWYRPNPSAVWAIPFCPHAHDLPRPQSGYPDIGRDYVPQVTITRSDGAPFTFLGFDTPSYMVAQSSRGGIAAVTPVEIGFDPIVGDFIFDYTHELSGPEWQNLSWVTLCGPFCFDSHATGLVDNLRFWVSVDEPPTLMLLLGSLLFGLGLRWRFKKHF